MPLALRLYDAANPATARIWIAMAMGWGVSRGAGNAGVAMQFTTKMFHLEIMRKREVNLTRMALT